MVYLISRRKGGSIQQPTQLVGIAGGSCSGKTTLVKELVTRLGPGLEVISFDDYFVGTQALKGRGIEDWESPRLYHMDRFVDDLAGLKAGHGVNIACRSRESVARGIISRVIEPKPLVIVEGFLIFHEPAARALFDRKFFVDLPEDEIVRRRLARIQGTSGWDDPTYIADKLLPGHRNLVVPQQNYADTILDGMLTTTQLADQVCTLLDIS